jgi:hypothetical protein
MDDDERATAWEELYHVLPLSWVVMLPVWRAGERLWAVYARKPNGPRHVIGPWRQAFGSNQTIALRILAPAVPEPAPVARTSRPLGKPRPVR